ncbi:hypothetical protein [Sphingomonas sp.]|uniref:hypothetical protein n=1 Tax=Sphingomonas sp. TaxID=28214 RepID=UPI0035BBD250
MSYKAQFRHAARMSPSIVNPVFTRIAWQPRREYANVARLPRLRSLIGAQLPPSRRAIDAPQSRHCRLTVASQARADRFAAKPRPRINRCQRLRESRAAPSLLPDSRARHLRFVHACPSRAGLARSVQGSRVGEGRDMNRGQTT